MNFMQQGLVVGVLLSASLASIAQVQAPIGKRIQVLEEPFLLGMWTRMEQIYPSRMIARGGAVRRLDSAGQPLGPVIYQLNGNRYEFDDYVARNAVTSLLVLKNGRIVYEQYFMGTDDNTRFTSWSMAKSITSTLLGLALEEDLIKSVDELASTYVPELAESGYGRASLRDLLQMTSGVRFIEDYEDTESLEGKAWVEAIVEQRLPFNQTALWFDEILHPSGTRFYYASMEPQVAGWVVNRATGEHLANYFSRRIWQKIGAEHDASWMLDRAGGMEIASCCFNATTRDYARLGLLMLENGKANGEQIVPRDWVQTATRPDPERAFLHPGVMDNDNGLGYQHYWWLWPKDDAYSAIGFGGQYMYINPDQQVVIVQTAVRSKKYPGSTAETIRAFEAIVDALR